MQLYAEVAMIQRRGSRFEDRERQAYSCPPENWHVTPTMRTSHARSWITLCACRR